jgi:hypothetical protein
VAIAFTLTKENKRKKGKTKEKKDKERKKKRFHTHKYHRLLLTRTISPHATFAVDQVTVDLHCRAALDCVLHCIPPPTSTYKYNHLLLP